MALASVLFCLGLSGCGGGGSGASATATDTVAQAPATAGTSAAVAASSPEAAASSAAPDAGSALAILASVEARPPAADPVAAEPASTQGAADPAAPASGSAAASGETTVVAGIANGATGTETDQGALPISAAAAAGGGNASASACTPTVASDFVDNIFWAYRRLLPRDCATVANNPVSFAWTQPKDRDTSTPWTLTVTTAAGATVATQTVASPRLTLTQSLAAGSYRWRVSYRTSAGNTLLSDWRRFVVDASTTKVNLPSAAELQQRLSARSGPRVLPEGQTWKSLADLANRGEYKNAFYMLPRTASAMLAEPVTASPESKTKASFASYGDYAAWTLSLMQLTGDELRRIEALAYAARLTGDATYLAAAKTRLLALAAWDPLGASSQANQPLANRNIYSALALGYDLLEADLTAAERTQVANAINLRLEAAVRATDLLDREPYSPFENSTIHHATQALLLVAGRPGFAPSAALLPKMWALCIAQFQALGAEDGSSGGGTAYAWYDFHSQTRLLATALVTAGVDLSQLAYAKRMGDFLIASTTPNAAQMSAFGDGNELKNLYASYSPDTYRLYAAVTGQAQHEWYWRQNPENVSLLGYINPIHFAVQALRPNRPTPVAPARTDWIFPDSGVVSFSTAADAARSTLQFRASPMGSFNHAHADQNSFTLAHKGADLLISSGYYPYYLSPHHASVTRATRFKNAVTFDGGIGQAEAVVSPTSPTAPVSSMEPRAELVQAYAQGKVSVATGDATLAYRGWNATSASWAPLVSAAHRSVAFLKSQGLVLVYDWMASASPRRWEWNYHGVQAFSSKGSQLVVSNGGVTACIDHIGPAGSLSTSSGFPVNPEGTYSTQYHAQWRASNAAATAGMVAVIRLDCNTTPVSVSWNGSKASVQVSGGLQRVEFDRRSVAVSGSTN